MAVGNGVMGQLCLCSMRHSAAIRGKRARRLFQGRTKGVVWHHSSVNLVDGREPRTGSGLISPADAEDHRGG
jgi:hypothetical protein